MEICEELANKWWTKNERRFVPYAWTGNGQYVNLPMILAAFAGEFRVADQKAVLDELS